VTTLPLTVHEALPQLVLCGVLRQPPLPSHLPSWAHGALLFTVQLPAVFGSCPPTIPAQVPSAIPFLTLEQEEQPPAQALLQQKPSTHWPVRHSAAAVHDCPLFFLVAHLAERGSQ